MDTSCNIYGHWLAVDKNPIFNFSDIRIIRQIKKYTPYKGMVPLYTERMERPGFEPQH